LPIPGGYRIAVLIHCESEGNVLPQCSHVSLADSILDEGGNLFEGSPRDSMLSNIHGPGLDGFPDFTGQFELDPFVGRAEISAVDGAIIDGKQIRVNPLLAQLSNEPLRLCGLCETLGTSALRPDFSQFHLETKAGRNDWLRQFRGCSQIILVLHVGGINGKRCEAGFQFLAYKVPDTIHFFRLFYRDVIPMNGEGHLGIAQPLVFLHDKVHETGRAEFCVIQFRFGNLVNDRRVRSHGGKDNPFHRQATADIAGHDHRIMFLGSLKQSFAVYEGNYTVGETLFHTLGTHITSLYRHGLSSFALIFADIL